MIAPNIIVLDRLARDFEGLRIFFSDPVIPRNGFEGRSWQDDFQFTVHLQDDVQVNQPTGNLFLSNIHRVYSGNEAIPSPDDDDSRDYFLGTKPTGATNDSKIDLGMIVRDIDELVVLNDEAHHIHNAKQAWFQSIADIHNRLVQKDAKLSLQLDVSATPRHTNGSTFAQTVVDYPLVGAIAQNVVKHPRLPDQASRDRLVLDPETTGLDWKKPKRLSNAGPRRGIVKGGSTNPRVNRAFNKQSIRAAAEMPVAAGHFPLLIPTAPPVRCCFLTRTEDL